jgi:hypothetical protein
VECCADRGIHPPAVSALYPDLMQHSHCFSLIPTGTRFEYSR